jgi:hypothetical protein
MLPALAEKEDSLARIMVPAYYYRESAGVLAAEKEEEEEGNLSSRGAS